MLNHHETKAKLQPSPEDITLNKFHDDLKEIRIFHKLPFFGFVHFFLIHPLIDLEKFWAQLYGFLETIG